MGSLIAAYTVAWVVVMIYVLTLAARQRRLRAALAQLQSRVDTDSTAVSQVSHGQ